jgi:hypothetical protein
MTTTGRSGGQLRDTAAHGSRALVANVAAAIVSALQQWLSEFTWGWGQPSPGTGAELPRRHGRR